MWFYNYKDTCEYTNNISKSTDAFYIFENRNNKRRFGVFPNYKEYYKYLNTLEPKNRNHYETVEGTVKQKPRFDIDISPEVVTKIFTPDDIINDLIYNIINFSKELDYNITFDDILLYESHGPTKYSFHIVINNWYHDNNTEAKAFYHGVINRMDSRNAQYIDPAVYNSLQEFRMLGNCKSGSDRVKKRIYKHKYYNELITWETKDPLEEFSDSLLTIFDIPPKHLYIPIKSIDKNNISSTININNIDIEIPDEFIIDKTTSYGIRLQRIKDTNGKAIPGECIVCRDFDGNSIVHENDNAFLTVKDNCVYFHCFRSPKHAYLLHVISEPSKLKLALEESNKYSINRENYVEEVHKESRPIIHKFSIDPDGIY